MLLTELKLLPSQQVRVVNGQVLATDGGGTLSFVDQSGGGAVGGGSDKLFMENGTTMTTNYTIGTEFGATCNALSAGPITINAGVTLTIPSGSVYTWFKLCQYHSTEQEQYQDIYWRYPEE